MSLVPLPARLELICQKATEGHHHPPRGTPRTTKESRCRFCREVIVRPSAAAEWRTE